MIKNWLINRFKAIYLIYQSKQIMEGDISKQFSSIRQDCLVFCALIKQVTLSFTVYPSLKEDIMFFQDYRYEELPESIQKNVENVNDLYQYLKSKHGEALTFDFASKKILIKTQVFGKERCFSLDLKQKNVSKNDKNERKIKFLMSQNAELKHQLLKKEEYIITIQQKLKYYENNRNFDPKKQTHTIKQEKKQERTLTNDMKSLIEFNYKHPTQEMTEIIEKHKYDEIFNLSLQKYNLPAIPPLKSLINLKILEIKNYESSNKLERITNLIELVNLQELNLGCNCIKKIEGLASLKKLRELYLYENQIQIIENLSDLVSLQKLYLNKNKIQNMSKQLLTLKKLKQIRLYQNQIDGQKPSNKKILAQLSKGMKVMLTIGEWYKSE